MLTAEEQGRVVVVLVRARNSGNIGAVARAMHDFGFGRLRTVSEYLEPVEMARSAVDAAEVMQAAEVFGTVAEAVADCTLVLGTTAVGERALEHPLLTARGAGERVAAHLQEAAGQRVALLFGSEKTGLSNAELSYCHALVTIPMAEHAGVRHASMNLGQAAAVCLYELVRERDLGPLNLEAQREGLGQGEVATGEETERLRGLLVEVLERSGYTRRYPANSAEEVLRRLLVRARPAAKDVPVWMGVLRQMLWALRER